MESLRVGLPTLLLVLVYLAGINVLGAWIGRGQKDARDYFLGSQAMPWWAVMGSIVATETSALTFLSIPGDAYRTGFAFLQLVFGYVIGRIAVSFLLLPSYFKGELTTVYALLETRFGPAARRFTSLLFMLTRVMAAAVRLAVPAIPIALILGIPIWTAVVILAGATALYTFLGGIKAVIWIDLIQVFVYLSGALLALGFLWTHLPGGLAGALSANAAAGQQALIGSGFVILVQMSLFLSIGVMLFAFFHGRLIESSSGSAFHSPDEIFPTFIVRHLPGFISACLVAGIFSAAMCSESSALNSLASALAHDVVGPLSGKKRLEGRSGLALGRGLTLFWTVLLALLAIGFSRLSQSQPAVQVGLGLLSVTAGGLLGAFLLAIYARRARQADVLAAVTCRARRAKIARRNAPR